MFSQNKKIIKCIKHFDCKQVETKRTLELDKKQINEILEKLTDRSKT